MNPELTENLEQQQQEETTDLSQELSDTPKKVDKVIDLKGLSDKDKDRIRMGKASIRDIRTESGKIKDQAENLIDIGIGQEKLTEKEAKKYKKQLNLTPSKEAREEILEEIQERLAQVETKEDKSKELTKSNPELQKAHKQYDRTIKDNADLLGWNNLEEYERWIREQKPSIESVEQATVKFFQEIRPPRVEVFNALKNNLAKYGIKSPLDVPYLKAEGLSERTGFLDNIRELEKHFQKMGDLRGKLYSRKAEKELMKTLCTAKNPQEQERILQKAESLGKDESEGFASLEAAVRADKNSQKEMDSTLDYYKKLDKWGKREENLKLWDGFIENEAKLTGKLKKVFEISEEQRQDIDTDKLFKS